MKSNNVSIGILSFFILISEILISALPHNNSITIKNNKNQNPSEKNDVSDSLSMIIFLIIMVILIFLFFCQKVPCHNDSTNTLSTQV